MKKNLFLVLIMSLFTLQASYAITSNNYSINEDAESVGQGGSNIVYMDCLFDPSVCSVVCIGGGPMECNIMTALDTDCWGCLENKVEPFFESQGQEMFDYANEQMNSGVCKGEFTKNLVKEDGKKIFRTVQWEVDNKGDRKSDLSITIVTE